MFCRSGGLGKQGFKFMQGIAYFLLIKRFKDVINTIILKGPDSVIIISGYKNGGPGDSCLCKYIE
jgi:hypothetical protein